MIGKRQSARGTNKKIADNARILKAGRNGLLFLLLNEVVARMILNIFCWWRSNKCNWHLLAHIFQLVNCPLMEIRTRTYWWWWFFDEGTVLSRLGVLSRVMVKGIEVYAQNASDFFFLKCPFRWGTFVWDVLVVVTYSQLVSLGSAFWLEPWEEYWDSTEMSIKNICYSWALRKRSGEGNSWRYLLRDCPDVIVVISSLIEVIF